MSATCDKGTEILDHLKVQIESAGREHQQLGATLNQLKAQITGIEARRLELQGIQQAAQSTWQVVTGEPFDFNAPSAPPEEDTSGQDKA